MSITSFTLPPIPPAAITAPDPDTLRRVLDAVNRKWRAESFLADKRDLPVFAAVTRELGWTGLHMTRTAA